MPEYGDLLGWLASDNGLRVHLGIIITLILGAFGIPIPEDIPLILGGVAASKGIVFVEVVFLSSYVGVLASDQIVFFLGRIFGPRLLNAGTKSTFFPSITEERIREVREGLRRRRLLYILISRHLFPVRSMTFLTAGALKIPFWEFFAADALAALVSVSVMLSIGYFLGAHITPEIIYQMRDKAHLWIVALAGIVALGLVFRFIMKKSVRAKNELN